MKSIFIFFTSFLIVVFSGCSSHTEISFTDKWDSVRVLKNPHKGWYHHLLDNGISIYPIKSDSVFASFPGMDHLYLRLAWSYLEPQEGKFDWHRIDEVVEKYVPEGYKISFRISCSETGRYPGAVGEEVNGIQYATPSWVKKAGAKGTIVDRGKGRTKSWVPKWGDPVFLEKLDQFHKAFAIRYDGKPWVSYIDIGSIGDWGEGHTSSSTRVPPTVEEVKANIDIYLKNYKKSQLVAVDDMLYYGKSDADVKTLYEYATSKGLTLRDDSPLVGWYVQTNLKTWSVSHPQFYDPLYLKKPIVFEPAHYSGVKRGGNWLGRNGAEKIAKYGYSGAEIMRKAIETMHATYIGYHGYVEDWLADNPDLAKELANLCGYWYFPVKATVPRKMVKDKNSISFEWLNKGVAPAYNTFGLLLRLARKNNGQPVDVLIEDSGNKNWLPYSITKAEYTFQLPENMANGNYLLKFKLVETSGDKYIPVDIGLKKSSIDPEGFIDLGSVTVR